MIINIDELEGFILLGILFVSMSIAIGIDYYREIKRRKNFRKNVLKIIEEVKNK